MKTFAVGITGGSGAPYALRLLDVLVTLGHEVHVVVSTAGATVTRLETGLALGKTTREMQSALDARLETDGKPGKLRVFAHDNLAAPIASGSFRSSGMVVIPCSTGSLGRIAAGISSNLIERAADVCLKERRPLIVVPRETPLSEIHLNNMLTLRRAGADILPAMPAFYHKPTSISDLVDMVVGRVVDRLGEESDILRRWEGKSSMDGDD